MFPKKKTHSIITKVFTKKLTHIANPVLYQYYQPTYLHIFFFEIGIFFFSSLSTYSGVYLFETFSTKEVGKIKPN